jgi:alkanesulfonate monooxygenase SsuD/methylene tetrahydromethanopterin reductase-like flavin-dependent oxidoreductase (luciferase family)
MRPVHEIEFGFTDHLESPVDRQTAAVLEEVRRYVRLADALGFRYYWFTEHHAHAHHGHIPTPLLLALKLASETAAIQLGTAVICLNLHHPLDVAEQTAAADILMDGRLAPGFGSGSTPMEFGLFGLEVTDEHQRHQRFREALEIIREAWGGEVAQKCRQHFHVPGHRFLPNAVQQLHKRAWVAVNSSGSAAIAGELQMNMLFSHLRTPSQYRQYLQIYHEAGGRGLAAANRPVFVAETDEEAQRLVEEPLRMLWRRFRDEGKIPPDTQEPKTPAELAQHPINFLFGSPGTVAQQICALHAEAPFDVLNLEPNWAGLPSHRIEGTLRHLARDVLPLVRRQRDAGESSLNTSFVPS